MSSRSPLAVLGLLALMGCSDDPVGPQTISLATMDPSVTRLVAFNDAGQALWRTDHREVFLWDGSQLLELPLGWAVDLDPEGGVIGDADQEEYTHGYWKDGDMTEVPGSPRGFDGEGRTYVVTSEGPRWWTAEDGLIGEAPAVSLPALWLRGVAEDGSILGGGWEADDPNYIQGRDTCYRITEASADLLISADCDLIAATTRTGIFLVGWGPVIDTRSDPWTEMDPGFDAWDVNDNMVFVTHDAEMRNFDGDVLLEFDAIHALINNRDEVLLMSPEGEIQIIK